MDRPILRLYPTPSEERPLAGTYLAPGLPDGLADEPIVYTNFISSLDGRISEVDPKSGRRRVPEAIANERDWRLYLELAAQADVLLTTSRHLRAVADGRHGGLPDFAGHPDLAGWRRARGMPPQPALAAVSEGLDIPVEALQRRYSGTVAVLAASSAPASKVERLEAQGATVLPAGTGPALDGRAISRALAARGWSRIYSIAGPRVAHALLAGGVLDRLYLTFATLVLGGREFDTLTLGNGLAPPARFTPTELYLDRSAPAGAAQLFGIFDTVPG